tara:strand:+ start:188 stop:733 length:546 start_codon:yes stop_codon:yes gene_type:complete
LLHLIFLRKILAYKTATPFIQKPLATITHSYLKITELNLKLKNPNILILISILIFIIACSQIVYCTNGNCGENWSGLAVLISGIFGIFIGGACITWLANPLILISWLTFKKTKFSLVMSIIALLFGMSFLFFDEIIINEAGHYGKITGYEMGFYLWNLSLIIMIIRNIISLKNKKTVANNV